MFRKISFTVLAICFAMALASCSGGKKSSGGGNSGGGGESNATVNGSVLYSPFTSDDKVCFDRNTNKQCDEGEPNAPITNGDFTIKGNSIDTLSSPILAELHGSATVSAFINAETKMGQKIVLETPAGRNFISSITTMIKAKMDMEAMDEDSATEKVKTDLGLAADVEVLAKSDNADLKTKADAVIKVLSAMITSIAGKGIPIDGNALLLIANETAAQLTEIVTGKTADQIVAATVGGKTKDDLTNAINNAVESKPTLETFGQALEKGDLEIFQLNYEGRGNGDGLYKISQLKMSKNNINEADITLSDAKSQDTLIPNYNFLEQKGLINSNGSFVTEMFESSYAAFNTIKAFPLKGRSAYSNSKFGNKEIHGFIDGAKMYEVSAVMTTAGKPDMEIDARFIECMQTKETNTNDLLDECAANIPVFISSDYSVTYNGGTISHNPSFGNNNSNDLGSVTLDKNSGTFTFNPSYQYYQRSMYSAFVFAPQFTMSGKYTETGSEDFLVIKGVSLNGDVMLYIASAKSNGGRPVLMIARNTRPLLSRYFNNEAMKTIRDNWDESVRPINW